MASANRALPSFIPDAANMECPVCGIGKHKLAGFVGDGFPAYQCSHCNAGSIGPSQRSDEPPVDMFINALNNRKEG